MVLLGAFRINFSASGLAAVSHRFTPCSLCLHGNMYNCIYIYIIYTHLLCVVCIYMHMCVYIRDVNTSMFWQTENRFSVVEKRFQTSFWFY